jgi:hypothetical protein
MAKPHPLHSRLPYQFGNLDFLYMGVDYDLVLLPPSIDIVVISEVMSNLCLCADEG